jgi:hypothetical protein
MTHSLRGWGKVSGGRRQKLRSVAVALVETFAGTFLIVVWVKLSGSLKT